MNTVILTMGPKTPFIESFNRCGIEVIPLYEKRFPDGEFFVRIPQNIRNQNCYLVLHMLPENVMDVIITIDTLRRAHAGKITLVTPYLPYSRQDRRVDTRTPLSARVLADCLESAGCDHVITMDVHALQVEGFYKIPFDNLQGASLLLNAIVKNNRLEEYVLVAPDAGAAKRTRHMGEIHKVPVVVLDKKRISDTQVESVLIGDVENKFCIMIDDIISSGGTIAEGARILNQNNAKSIIAACSHMLTNAQENKVLPAAPIDGLYSLNTTHHNTESHGYHTIVDASALFIEAVLHDIHGKSIASMFNQR
jgi:ribose-phosphate pyrophosphokinase